MGIIANHIDVRMPQGYFRSHDDGLTAVARRLGESVKQLVAADWPPVFIFLFDQAWDCFARLHYAIRSLLGNYRRLPNFWCWHIGPGQSGWKPHRDRGRSSLSKDGRPDSMTVWIPLAQANLGNSCIHVLPIQHDPTYGTDREWVFEIDAAKAVALEVEPGDFIGWNQSVVHWGSAAGPCLNGPRLSISVEFQKADVAPFESPTTSPDAELDFRVRMWLVARQIVQYIHMEPRSPELLSFAERIYVEGP